MSTTVSGILVYQLRQQTAVYRMLKADRVAVDVGAHVGLWSREMAKIFGRVHAFEPVAELRECFRLNVPMEKVTLYECALGDRPGAASVAYDPARSGETGLIEGDDVEVRRLDDFGLEDVDLIKIDVEGYEPFVVEGATETIRRCRPVVVVEQKGHGSRWGFERYAATRMLMDLGMLPREVVVDDFIMVWP